MSIRLKMKNTIYLYIYYTLEYEKCYNINLLGHEIMKWMKSVMNRSRRKWKCFLLQLSSIFYHSTHLADWIKKKGAEKYQIAHE